MISRYFRILLPAPPVVSVENPTPTSPPVVGVGRSEHERLSAGTADLWRQLVHLCMETPT